MNRTELLFLLLIGLLAIPSSHVGCNNARVETPDDSAAADDDEGDEGDEADEADTPVGTLRYFSTCGDPVCGGHQPDPNVSACTSEAPGAACSSAGALCDPGNDCNSYLVCAETDPKLQPGGCPISSARFKRDIRYLDEAERELLREALLRMPLARYHYRGESEGAPLHLGFIIEDVGVESPAVAPSGDQVELYGYMSMAVATIQAQDARIRALEARLEALEAELRVARP